MLMRNTFIRPLALIIAVTVVAHTRAVAQGPIPGAAAGAVVTEEAAALAEGWIALAQGQFDSAATLAAQVLGRNPHSPSALSFATDVAIARQGWQGGLSVYEQWMAGRTLESPHVLRRVARAVLYDALATESSVPLRVDIADALTRDGDADVAAHVRQLAGREGVDTRTIAAAGDEQAVARLAASLPNDSRPVDSIQALGRSRSREAIAPLVAMLDSERSEVRAAAALALGDLDAREAIPRLRRMLDDPQVWPRMGAAGSLLRMGDGSPAALLQEWFNSDVSDIRLRAAEISAFRPDANWVAQVQRLLQDSDPMVRIGAAKLLSRHDAGAARAAMQALTNDSNLAIREEALRALPQTIGGDLTQLRYFMRAPDSETRVRAALQIVEQTR